MWDSNSPLQLLKTMPKKLSKENLEKLQLVIDADKYKNSLISGFDLCGMYAPFCRGCKKTSIFPCAIAYINMIRAEGADIEIDARPVETAETSAVQPEVQPVVVPEQKEEHEIPAVQETAVSSAVIEPEYAEAEEIEEPVAVSEPKTYETVSPSVHNNAKRKIRIAVARRKM